MKRLANLLMTIGAVIAIIAFNFDVTGGGRFVNMDLMAQRQNLLMVGCVAFLAGIVLLVGAQRQGGPKDGESDKLSKTAAAPVQPKAPLDLGLSVLIKKLLEGKPLEEVIGRLIGSIAASVNRIIVCSSIAKHF